MRYKKRRIPKTLYTLLRLTIKDAEKIDREKYCPDWQWFYIRENTIATNPPDGSKCLICLAGARLITLLPKGFSASSATPREFGNDEIRCLHAIDELREGRIYQAGKQFYGYDFTLSYNRSINVISPYKDFRNWGEFDNHLAWLKETLLPKLKVMKI